MALALVLIYKATGVINFAQGDMAMFGTFIACVFIADHGVADLARASLLAMLLSAVGAAVIERVFIRPFDPQQPPGHHHRHAGLVLILGAHGRA